MLSPDGHWLSWLAEVDGVMNVWLAPVGAPEEARPLTRQTERPIFFHWFARDSRHVLYGRDTGGDENFHLWCVGVDGSEPRDLTPYGAVTFRWCGAHKSNPNLIAVGLNDRDARWHDLYEIDITPARAVSSTRTPARSPSSCSITSSTCAWRRARARTAAGARR